MKHGCFTICRKFSLALAILALAGCSYFFAPRVELQRLTLDVAARASDDSPIAVDFVAVKDAELFRNWPDCRPASGSPIASSTAATTGSSSRYGAWSWSRGSSSSRSPSLARRPRNWTLVFAGYNTPGAHRLRLDQQQRVWLRLDTREMRLVNDPATRWRRAGERPSCTTT